MGAYDNPFFLVKGGHEISSASEIEEEDCEFESDDEVSEGRQRFSTSSEIVETVLGGFVRVEAIVSFLRI